MLEYKVKRKDGSRKAVHRKNGRNRKVRLLSPLKTPDGREVMELECNFVSELKRGKNEKSGKKRMMNGKEKDKQVF